MPSRWIVALFAATVLALGVLAAPTAGAAPALTRNPYLTDATATSVRVNWATASTGTAKVVTWGPAGAGCNQYTATATGTSFTVGSTTETMWSARLGNLAPRTSYCYQIVDGASPVLAAPITFTTIPAPGDAASFSFDVIGDTGYNGNGGSNPDQDRLYAEMAGSGASFVLTTGDMAYPDGSQNNYGDLVNTGPNVSNVFGPAGWSVFGGSAPTFPVLGNHGRSGTFLQNWPTSDAVSSSAGKFAMVSYPGQSGASTASYPTDYYAFDVGPARFYVLDADWTDSNVGTSTLYGQDYLNHWSPGTAEYEWLKADLAAHPGGMKFATFHFPLHSDNATEASDTYLQGASSLEGLLSSNGVDMVFNGHAHMYERNAPALGNMVSYVTGGGGAVLEPTGGFGCTAIDALLHRLEPDQQRRVAMRERDRADVAVAGVPLPARDGLRVDGDGRAAECARPDLRRRHLQLPQHAAAGHHDAGAHRGHLRLLGCAHRAQRHDEPAARVGGQLPQPAALRHERRSTRRRPSPA